MSLRVDLDTKDYDIKMRVVQSLAIPNFTPEAVAAGADIIEEELQLAVPVKTGNLQSSIQKFVDTLSAVIRTNSGYGRFVDEPTGAHEIRATRAKALRIELSSGDVIFRKKIQHPGTAGHFFRQQAITNSMPRLLDKFVEIWNSLTGSV